MACFTRLPNGRLDEPSSDSSIVVVRMDMELVELCPPLDSRVEPCGLGCGAPHHKADHPTTCLCHSQPAGPVVHRVVHEEHRVDAADIRGIFDPERPKPRPGGLPMRHVAFIPPPLSG